MNALSLSGRLTKDFEFVKNVAKSSLAVETWDKKTFFVDLVAFKNTAEYIVKCKLTKGTLVAVDGELNVNKYNDKIYVQCIVKDITIIGKKKDVADDEVKIVESGASLGQPSGDVNISDDVVSIDDVTDDDLPF